MTGINRRRVKRGVLTSQLSSQGSRIMTATLIARIVAPSLALVAACGAALVFGITPVRREPPVATSAATAAPATSPPASSARHEGSAALATAQAEANAVAAPLAVSPRSPDTDESVPVFDIARIERTGDAVIAGRAAPGAIVELLLNGERHHQEVADQSGLFVMMPPRLPPGDYELTLRSREPDGKQATSKQSVVVALAEVESSSGAARSRAEVPFNVPETVGANRSVLDHTVGASQPHQPSQLQLQIAKGQDIAVSQLPHALPPPLCQTEAHRPSWSCPRPRLRSYPVATASGASAVSPTARARDTRLFTKQTKTKFEIQIVFIPARSLSFL